LTKDKTQHDAAENGGNGYWAKVHRGHKTGDFGDWRDPCTLSLRWDK